MKRLLCIALFLSGETAQAETPDLTPDLVSISGVGALSCGKFLEHKAINDSRQMALYVEWSWGYISAYNKRRLFGNQPQGKTKNPIPEMPDPPTVIAFLENYCRNNPLDTIAIGVDVLIRELGGSITVKEYRK